VNAEEKQIAWENYGKGIGVATTYEEGAEVMREWLHLNPWFEEKYDIDENCDRIIAEMEKHGYKPALVTITAAVNSLFGQGLMKRKTVSQAALDSKENPKLKQWVKDYAVMPTLDAKNKRNRDPEFRELMDRAIQLGLI
jgi:hypothetical protein